MRRIVLLCGGLAAVWVLLAVPARYVWGEYAVAYSGTAMLLCLVPAVATLAWAGWGLAASPEQQLAVVLGGTGVRLFVVLTAYLALVSWVPYYHEQPGFWAWLLVFYLCTLALEIALMLASRPAAPHP